MPNLREALFADDSLSDEARSELLGFADRLEHGKIAADFDEISRAVQAGAGAVGREVATGLGEAGRGAINDVGDIGHAVLTGAVNGLTLLGVGALGAAGTAGAQYGYSALTRGRDLHAVTAVYPEINEYPKKEVDLAYNSLRHLNPQFAKDPLVAGTLMKQILQSRDMANPKSIRFEHTLADSLARSAPRVDDSTRRMAVDSLTQGMSDAFRAQNGRAERRLKRRMAREDRAFRTESAEGDRAFRRSFAEEDRKARAESDEKNRVFNRAQALADRAFRRSAEDRQLRARRRDAGLEQRRRAELERLKSRNALHREVVKAHYARSEPVFQGATPSSITQYLQQNGFFRR